MIEDSTTGAEVAPTEENQSGIDNTDAASKKERAPRAKQGKIIVRNLGFDLREKHLKAAFSKFGSIKEVNVPVNPSTNMNRGFAFVEFSSRQEATEAI